MYRHRYVIHRLSLFSLSSPLSLFIPTDWASLLSMPVAIRIYGVLFVLSFSTLNSVSCSRCCSVTIPSFVVPLLVLLWFALHCFLLCLCALFLLTQIRIYIDGVVVWYRVYIFFYFVFRFNAVIVVICAVFVLILFSIYFILLDFILCLLFILFSYCALFSS